MSNHLAIATVTAALAQVVQVATRKGVQGAVVRIGRPDRPTSSGTPHVVQLYLYQVSPNAAMRNVDLPSRDSQGRLTQLPQAALDLDYLLTFYGDEGEFEPERMLGAVVRHMKANPVLPKQAIHDAIAAHSDLADSDLASAVERVRFTPLAHSLDELSKLWSVFFQTPHALSVVYRASVVLIEAEGAAEPAPPVLRRGPEDRGAEVLLGPFPRLDEVHVGWAGDTGRRPRLPSMSVAQLSPPFPAPPAAPDPRFVRRLTFRGSSLAGDSVGLEFVHPRLDAPLRLVPVYAVGDEIRFDLPAVNDAQAQVDWAPGLYTVQAIVERGGQERESNLLPLPLAPRILQIKPDSPIAGAGGDVPLTLTCSPRVLPKQRVDLLLAGRRVRAEDHPAPTDTLKFVVPQAPAVQGVLVRLRVDGVESVSLVRQGDPPRMAFDDDQKVTIQ